MQRLYPRPQGGAPTPERAPSPAHAPAHVPAHEHAHDPADDPALATPAGLAASFKWFGETVPTWSGGPWKISKFVNNQSVTEVPNDKFWGTKPKLAPKAPTPSAATIDRIPLPLRTSLLPSISSSPKLASWI